MHKNPNRLSPKKSSKKQPAHTRLNKSTAHHVSQLHQHHHQSQDILSGGIDSATTDNARNNKSGYLPVSEGGSILHGLPWETLANVTAYLDPKTLLTLGLVDKYLRGHVENERVWQLAFMQQYFGFKPEQDLSGAEEEEEKAKLALLFRVQKEWKKEYVIRWNTIRRWQKSKTTTTSHSPVQTSVATAHLLNDRTSLLTFSSRIGLGARSYPANGKVLKGALYPWNPDPDGVVWGRPFHCAYRSESSQTRAAWATSGGAILTTSYNRVMDTSTRRQIGSSLAAPVYEHHDGPLSEITWSQRTVDGGTGYFITAGTDGRIKIWNASTCRLAMGFESPGALALFAKYDTISQVAVAAYSNGDVASWTGIDFETQASTRISFKIPDIDSTKPNQPSIDQLLLDCKTGHPCVYAHVESTTHIWKIMIVEGEYILTKLVGTLASVTSLHLHSSSSAKKSLIIAGDSVGRVSIWSSQQDNITLVNEEHPCLAPLFSWDAFDESAIHSLAHNDVVIATGNSKGVVKIWDALTFTHLRTFKSPAPRPEAPLWPVSQIILDMNQVVYVVGKYVVFWKAGPVTTTHMHKRVEKVSTRAQDIMKWGEYKEAMEDSEARFETGYGSPPIVSRRAREQMDALQQLGLDEAGAVEYALMLSHEEAIQQGFSTDSSGYSPPTTSEKEGGMPSSPWRKISMSKASPPSSLATGKVHVTPPYRPEAMAVGDYDQSGSGSGSASRTPPATSSKVQMDDEVQFPSISPPLSRQSTKSRSPSPPTPTQKWSTIAKPPVIPATMSEVPIKIVRGKGKKRMQLPPMDDEEAQLQFALELSMIETGPNYDPADN